MTTIHTGPVGFPASAGTSDENPFDKARALQARGEHGAVIALLAPIAERANSKSTWELLGDAHHMSLDYAKAAETYEKALQLSPSDPALKKKLTTAIQVGQSGTDKVGFTEAQIAKALAEGPEALPPRPKQLLDLNYKRPFLQALARGVGAAIGKLVDPLVERMAHGSMDSFDGEKFQNFETQYRKLPHPVGTVLRLLKNHGPHRGLLFKHNRFFPRIEETELSWRDPAKFPEHKGKIALAQTPDASWHDETAPTSGRAGDIIGRFVSMDDSRKKLVRTNEAKISKALLHSKSPESRIGAAWINTSFLGSIQANFHSWQEHYKSTHFVDMPLPEDHPLRQEYGVETMKVRELAGEVQGSWFRNAISGWWNASNVKGHNKASQDRVRSFQDGKLKLSDKGLLPRDPETGRAIVGFDSNMNLPLEYHQTIMVHFHNHVCDVLKANYPQMTDEDLFQRAAIATAIKQAKIHTDEWTSVLLASDTLTTAMRTNWYGMLPALFNRDPKV